MDTVISQLLKQGELAGRAELLQSVKGIGEISATVLLAFFPELPKLDKYLLKSLD